MFLRRRPMQLEDRQFSSYKTKGHLRSFRIDTGNDHHFVDLTSSPANVNLMGEVTYFHTPIAIDTVGDNVVEGAGNGLLEAIFAKIDGRKEKIALTAILSPKEGLHFFLSARTASGKHMGYTVGGQRQTASLQIGDNV